MSMSSRIILGGVDKVTFNESYYLIDRRSTERFSINNSHEVAALERLLSEGLHRIPYNYASLSSLIPYFLHPHSFLSDAAGALYIFYKQAHYFTKIHPSGKLERIGGCESLKGAYIYSSTNHISSDGKTITLTRSPFIQRLDRYNSESALIDFEIVEYDTEESTFRSLCFVPGSIRDTIHQVGVLPCQTILSVEMNLAPINAAYERAWPKLTDDNLREYTKSEFDYSRLFVTCCANEDFATKTVTPKVRTAAHVEPASNGQSFFVSCHNMSKYQSDVVIHGPGQIEKYSLTDGQPVLEASFSRGGFNRITSMMPLLWRDREVLAVTNYPNKITLLSQDNLDEVAEFVLYESEELSPPYVCPRDQEGILFLAPSVGGEEIWAVGAQNAYFISQTASGERGRFQYNDDGRTAITTHCGAVDERTMRRYMNKHQ